MVHFEITRSDAIFRASFAAPLFELTSADGTAKLAKSLYRGLAPFGMQLDQLAIQNRGPVGTSYIEVPLMTWAASLRVSLSQLELQHYNLGPGGPAKFAAMAAAAEAATQDAFPGTTFGTTTLAFAWHGQATALTTKAIIGRYVTSDPKIGATLTSGVIFSLLPGSDEPAMAGCTLRLEHSELVPDGLFVRLEMAWAGTSVQGVKESAERFIPLCFARLGFGP